jgi:hypothetical protein
MPGRLGRGVNVTQVTAMRDDLCQFIVPCYPLTDVFERRWSRMSIAAI